MAQRGEIGGKGQSKADGSVNAPARIFRLPKPACLAAACLALIGLSSAAGQSQPTLIRTATIDGVTGPVYYSVVDGAYHRVLVLDMTATGSIQPRLAASLN